MKEYVYSLKVLEIKGAANCWKSFFQIQNFIFNSTSLLILIFSDSSTPLLTVVFPFELILFKHVLATLILELYEVLFNSFQPYTST